MMIAPDGDLWRTRWDQVRFSSRPVVNLNDNGVGLLNRAGLTEAYRTARPGAGDGRKPLAVAILALDELEKVIDELGPILTCLAVASLRPCLWKSPVD